MKPYLIRRTRLSKRSKIPSEGLRQYGYLKGYCWIIPSKHLAIPFHSRRNAEYAAKNMQPETFIISTAHTNRKYELVKWIRGREK